jgi:carbon starvation protein CstA
MITEGVVALIWATVAMFFFYNNPTPGYETIAGGAAAVGDAPSVVNLICNDWLGVFGGILAILGVVAAPITSGDTALRSARLIIADFIKVEQHSISKRLAICIPLFAVVMALLIWQMNDKEGFNMIWSWFGWSNQTLSVFMLWAITVYLVQQKKPYVITLIPAIFMTVVCVTFLLSEQMFKLSVGMTWGIAAVTLIASLVWFYLWLKKNGRIEELKN